MKSFKFIILGLLVISLTACTEANIEKVGSVPKESVKSDASPIKEEETVKSDASPIKEEESKSPEPSTPELYNVGDSVKFDDLIITVNGVRESKGDLFKPKEGNVFIFVDVTAENKGTEEGSVSSMLQTEVVDGDGFNYTVALADGGKGNFDGAVGVGRKLRGEIAFEVPKSATLEFIYSDPFKSGQAIWKIK